LTVRMGDLDNEPPSKSKSNKLPIAEIKELKALDIKLKK